MGNQHAAPSSAKPNVATHSHGASLPTKSTTESSAPVSLVKKDKGKESKYNVTLDLSDMDNREDGDSASVPSHDDEYNDHEGVDFYDPDDITPMRVNVAVPAFIEAGKINIFCAVSHRTEMTPLYGEDEPLKVLTKEEIAIFQKAVMKGIIKLIFAFLVLTLIHL